MMIYIIMGRTPYIGLLHTKGLMGGGLILKNSNRISNHAYLEMDKRKYNRGIL